MPPTTFSRKLHIFFRFLRRRSRGLRRFCISLLSVALIIDRVARLAEDLWTRGWL